MKRDMDMQICTIWGQQDMCDPVSHFTWGGYSLVNKVIFNDLKNLPALH